MVAHEHRQLLSHAVPPTERWLSGDFQVTFRWLSDDFSDCQVASRWGLCDRLDDMISELSAQCRVGGDGQLLRHAGPPRYVWICVFMYIYICVYKYIFADEFETPHSELWESHGSFPLEMGLCYRLADDGRYSSQFVIRCFTEMRSGSEEGSYLRLIDFSITQL